MTLEARQAEFAKLNRITYDEYKILVKNLTYDEVITCLELLKATKHKSDYRARMEKQVRAWFVDPGIHSKPLSFKQFEATKPKWPVRYNLPT